MRIGTKLLGCTLGIVLAGTLVSSWWTTRIANDALTSAIIGRLTSISTGRATEFGDHFELFEYGLEAASETQIVANTLARPDDTAAREQAEVLLTNMHNNLDPDMIRWVAVLSMDGKVLARSKQDLKLGTAFGDQDFFRQALQNNKYFSTPILDRASGLPIFYIAAPIHEIGGTTIRGVVCMSVNLKAMGEHLLGNLELGKLGYGYLSMRPGTTLYHRDAQRFFEDTTKFDWSREIMTKGTGWLAYTFGNTDRLAAFAEIPRTKWIVTLVVNRAEALAGVTELQKAGWLASALMLLVVGVVIFFSVRSITTALNRGVGFAQNIAAGDLSKDMITTRRDELGTLGRALQAMLVRLREMIATADNKTHDAEQATQQAAQALGEAEQARLRAESARREGLLEAATRLEVIVGRLASASEQLSAQVTQATRGADIQRERLSGTASAMEEMNATVLEVARSAAQSATISEQARKQAENGASQVQNVVSGMRQVNTNTCAMGDKLQALDQQAAGIGQIMGVISDIADQTNLLALNAAIEAARAGDAGRGFAVVADEVRKLAEKTMTATRQVGDAVRAIQSGTNEVVHAMEDTTRAVDSTTDLAGQAGTSLTEIVSIVAGSTDHARAIAAASEEQSATSEEIRHGTEEINTIATETARAMNESAQAVAELSHLSQQLQQLVEQLKKG